MIKSVSTLSAGLSLVACMSATRHAHATQPLETFLQRASVTAFDVRESAATVGQRDAEADASLGLLLPALTARGVYTYNQHEPKFQLPGTNTTVILQKHNVLEGIVQLDVPLVNITQYHRYKSQRALHESAQERSKAVTLDVGRTVTAAYYRFLGASALVVSAERSVRASADNLRIVSARHDAGAATDLDRERALSNVERNRQDVADALLLRDLAARQLETLSGLAPTAADSFPADDLHDESPIQGWLAQADETPLAKAARSAQKAAIQAKKAADASLFPTLAGVASERATNSPGLTGNNFAYQLQLVAQIRLDYAVVSARRAQQYAADASGIQSERTLRNAQDFTYESYRRVETSIVKSRSARAQAVAAARASALSSERYQAGVATQLDVIQAQRDAFLADASRITADAELAAARAQLRLSVGQAPTVVQNTTPLSDDQNAAVAPETSAAPAPTTPHTPSTPAKSTPATPVTPPRSP